MKKTLREVNRLNARVDELNRAGKDFKVAKPLRQLADAVEIHVVESGFTVEAVEEMSDALRTIVWATSSKPYGFARR
jgi:hypothetical protein